MAKRKRRARQAEADHDNPVIGYVATVTGRELWCAGETEIVANSERQMRTYLAGHLAFSAPVFRIALVSLETLLFGLRRGEGYALDRTAYERLVPLAQQAGLEPEAEAFWLEAPSGETGPAIELVRVQLRR